MCFPLIKSPYQVFCFFHVISLPNSNRVPVRKPGLNNGEIFKPLAPLTVSKKTHSVPNLFDCADSVSDQSSVDQATQQLLAAHASTHMVPLPPPCSLPPPPPASVIPAPPTSIYAAPIFQPIANVGNSKQSRVHSSPSSDTLVHEENGSVSERPFDDLEIDYDLNSNEDPTSNAATYIEPAVDYDQPKLLSTFNNPNKTASQTVTQANNSNSNLIMVMNRGSPTSAATSTPSPLTPRQIKQRNIAKRSSIPCRSSSSTPTLNDSINSLNNSDSAISNSASSSSSSSSSQFSAQQLSDLHFLQSQKFDADFIGTTRDLFSRYPHAKISISVTVSSTQTNSQSRQQTSTQTTRQIEIDKPMFDRIASLQLPHSTTATTTSSSKVQPQTPIRTSSALTSSSPAPNTTAHSLSSLSSSSSPSSSSSASSYSSSNYDSAINMEPAAKSSEPKTEDLHEAIKRVANEKLKRQQQQQQQLEDSSNKPNQQTSFKAAAVHKLLSNQSHTGTSKTSSAVSGKSELECAIENRFRRSQQMAADSVAKSANQRATVIPVPPPLPPAGNFKSLSSATSSSLPPPPSPQDLDRLNSADSPSTITSASALTTKQQQRPKCPPPPPPPIAPLLNGTSSLSYKSQASVQQIIQAANSKSTSPLSAPLTVKASSVVASTVDPRTSSDFSALIAKKAAEKRAKFSETKPSSVHTVTFQPGGSKLDSNPNIAKIQVQDQQQSKPKVLVPKPNSGGVNVTNIVKKMAQTASCVESVEPAKSVVTINSGVKDKVSIFSQQQQQPMPLPADGKKHFVL
jgi:hypothetical protein